MSVDWEKAHGVVVTVDCESCDGSGSTRGEFGALVNCMKCEGKRTQQETVTFSKLYHLFDGWRRAGR